MIPKKFDYSFEIFPPNTLEGFGTKCAQLAQLKPQFFSVTFGAAGSSQWKTPLVVKNLLENDISAVPHLTCINMSKQRVTALLNDYMRWGVKQLVVIRGDYPANDIGEGAQDFNFANEMVNYIRETTGEHFHIAVAAYPEFHPQAISPEDDLFNFKRKIAAGANSAITQCFFNSDAYFRFIDCCNNIDINIDVIPGILPITDYNKLLRFSKTCGAEIPLWLRKRLENYANNAAYLKDFGIEITTRLCEQLINNGVSKLHFYTLNQIEPVSMILKNLGLNDSMVYGNANCIPSMIKKSHLDCIA